MEFEQLCQVLGVPSVVLSLEDDTEKSVEEFYTKILTIDHHWLVRRETAAFALAYDTPTGLSAGGQGLLWFLWREFVEKGEKPFRDCQVEECWQGTPKETLNALLAELFATGILSNKESDFAKWDKRQVIEQHLRGLDCVTGKQGLARSDIDHAIQTMALLIHLSHKEATPGQWTDCDWQKVLSIAPTWAERDSVMKWMESLGLIKITELNEFGYATHVVTILNWPEVLPPSMRPKRLTGDRWRKLRQKVFYRDKYTCQYCGERNAVLHCDHIIPISRGGSNNVENLTTACEKCNAEKHAKTPDEWLGGN